MASTFECPKCGRELKVPDELLGKKVKCPACQSVFITAAEEEPPAPKPAASEPPEGIIPSQPAPGAIEESTEEEPPRKRPRRWEDDYEEEEYQPRSRRRRAQSAVVGPAIALMVLGGLDAVISLAALILHILVAMKMADPDPQRMAQPGFAFGFQVGKYSWSAFDFVGICIGSLLFLGAWKMKNLENYGFAMTVSIMALLPCHYCCLLGIAFGIWALIVLNQEDVKSAFG